MKQVYNFVLTILTMAMLAFLTFAKINETTCWVDLSAYTDIIAVISTYGPMVLLCLFAFGSLFGKIMSKIFFIIIVLLLVAFTISMFFPDVVNNIFGNTATIIGLIK